MSYTVEFEREVDGRWIAEIPSLPGVMVYGSDKDEARQKVVDLAREVLAAAEVESGHEHAEDVQFAMA